MVGRVHFRVNSPHQIRRNKDSPLHHWEDIIASRQTHGQKGELTPPENGMLRKVLTDNVTETLRWLMDKCIVFFGPMPELPNRKPRMHVVVPNSRAYIYHLQRHARKIGVEIRVNQRAQKLLRDGERVIGVECADADGGQHQYVARGGVVLTSGDFSANREMKARYISEQAARIGPINPASTGDGQRMAMEIGARILNGHFSYTSLRFLAPARQPVTQRIPPWPIITKFIVWALAHLPESILRPFVLSYVTTFLVPELKMFAEGAILVNKNGERFVDELDKPEIALLDEPDQCGYAIMDDTTAQKFSAWPYYISTAPGVAYAYLPDYRRNRPDVYACGNTIAELAQRRGIPAAALEKTVADYNQAAGKSGNTRPAILNPPYHSLGPIKYLMGFTEGGLAVNESLQVLGDDDQPIPGCSGRGAGQAGAVTGSWPSSRLGFYRGASPDGMRRSGDLRRFRRREARRLISVWVRAPSGNRCAAHHTNCNSRGCRGDSAGHAEQLYKERYTRSHPARVGYERATPSQQRIIVSKEDST